MLAPPTTRLAPLCAAALLAFTICGLALADSAEALFSGSTARSLGLEEWFDYESVETGAGSRAHVNLATGNLVWHSTPLINPGRGLSTFLNLTYNEQDICDGILHNLIGDGSDYEGDRLLVDDQQRHAVEVLLRLVRQRHEDHRWPGRRRVRLRRVRADDDVRRRRGRDGLQDVDLRVRRNGSSRHGDDGGQDAGLRVRRHDRSALAGARAHGRQERGLRLRRDRAASGPGGGPGRRGVAGLLQGVRDGRQRLGGGTGGVRRDDQGGQSVPVRPVRKIENEAQIEQAAGPGRENPFRFESFYYDSGVKQYDMRARNYRPEIGRFTSQDRFESASKDFNLQADPLTQNRYAFAGGNPVNRVEFDGHDIIDDVGLDDERDDAKKTVKKAGKAAKDFGEGAVESGKETVEAAKDPKGTAEGLASAGESFVKDPVGSSKKAVSAVGKCFETNAAKCAGKTAAGVLGGKGVGAAAKGAKAAAKGAKAGKAGGWTKSPSNRAAPDCNSFVPGTPVLMADGTTKPIEDVRVGDLVLATLQMTGQAAAHPVTELIEGLGQKHLIRITADGKTTVATLEHPYLLADEHRWIPAGSLSVGDRLQRPDGSTVVVEAVRQFTVLRARVHNLTVEGAHTYYAGGEPALVHNGGCGSRGRQARLRELGDDPKVSSADRGWIKNEQRRIKTGNRTSIRNPKGKDLAHERGREAAKGFGHREAPSNLQDRDLHRLQHKHDDFGRKNKKRTKRR